MKLGPRQKQWLKDLPNFPKTTDSLAHSPDGKCLDGFCCLGVYAHTQIDAPWENMHQGEPSFRTPDGSLISGDLGVQLSKELGLRDVNGKFEFPIVADDGFTYSSLVELNDKSRKDHAWAAEFIRKHADKIFTKAA